MHKIYDLPISVPDQYNGVWQHWMSNGFLKYECQFENGVLIEAVVHQTDKKWTTGKYKNGRVYIEAYYLVGVLQDMYVYDTESDVLKYEFIYSADKCIDRRAEFGIEVE